MLVETPCSPGLKVADRTDQALKINWEQLKDIMCTLQGFIQGGSLGEVG
jgi:hypothetical protein